MGIPELPIALRQVLGGISDTKLRSNYEQVFVVAASVINRLRDMDLTQYELEVADEGHNLEMLEQVAPVLAATLVDVNALVKSVAGSFPESAPLTKGSKAAVQQAERAVEILRTRSKAFHTEVMQLGIQLRSPRAVADRWNFLNHLQTARGRLRWGIGEMVADAASVYAEVTKAAVIPEYLEDIDMAVSLRRLLNRFAVGVRAQLNKIEGGSAQPLPVLLGTINQAIDAFAKTKTWRELRAPDKREFITFRAQLRELAGSGATTDAVLNALKGFVSFLELLAALLNQRETLRTHDHACLADLTAQLEQLEQVDEAARAGDSLTKLLKTCEKLSGRDDELDQSLRELRKDPAGSAAQIAELREHVQRLLRSAGA